MESFINHLSQERQGLLAFLVGMIFFIIYFSLKLTNKLLKIDPGERHLTHTMYIINPRGNSIRMIIDTNIPEQIETIYKSPSIPDNLPKIETTYPDMLEVNSSELSPDSLHYFEAYLKEFRLQEYLLTSPGDARAASNNPQLPLDQVVDSLAKKENPTLIRITVRPRPDLNSIQEAHKSVISDGKDPKLYIRIWVFFWKAVTNSFLDESADTTTSRQEKLMEEVDRSKEEKSFDIRIQGIVIAPDSPSDKIAKDLDETLSYLNKVPYGNSRIQMATSHPDSNSLLSTLPFRDSHADRIRAFFNGETSPTFTGRGKKPIIEGGPKIWDYLLVTSHTLDSTARHTDSILRDQTTTKRPSEKHMEHLRGDDPFEREDYNND